MDDRQDDVAGEGRNGVFDQARHNIGEARLQQHHVVHDQ